MMGLPFTLILVHLISISEKLRQLQCSKIKDLPFRIKYKSTETQI